MISSHLALPHPGGSIFIPTPPSPNIPGKRSADPGPGFIAVRPGPAPRRYAACPGSSKLNRIKHSEAILVTRPQAGISTLPRLRSRPVRANPQARSRCRLPIGQAVIRCRQSSGPIRKRRRRESCIHAWRKLGDSAHPVNRMPPAVTAFTDVGIAAGHRSKCRPISTSTGSTRRP